MIVYSPLAYDIGVNEVCGLIIMHIALVVLIL